MLHFDTNALIALPEWAQQQNAVIKRVLAGEPAGACSIVWYEYVVGPLADDEARLARAFLQAGIAPVSEDDAMLAARLYNVVGRHRRFKTDAIIAAAAINADAELVTVNTDDFQPFVAHGLRLLAVEV